MNRILPWILVVAAVGAVSALAFVLLVDRGETALDADFAREDEGEHTQRPARLQGQAAEREAREVPPDGRYLIWGMVHDVEGRGLGGVAVRADHRSFRDAWDGPAEYLRDRLTWLREGKAEVAAPAGEAVSADDGRFVIRVAEAGTYRVRALPSLPRCSSEDMAYLKNRREAQVVIWISESAPLEGRVLGPGGAGVVAEISATTGDAARRRFSSTPVVTDPETGRFRIDDLPAGRWKLTVRLPGRLALIGHEVQVPHEGLWTLRLGENMGRVEGRVTDGAGAPLAAAEILIKTRAASGAVLTQALGITSESGTYTIDAVPAGDIVEVGVLRDGFLAQSSRPPIAPWSPKTVEPGASTRLDLVLEPGAVIEGRVYDRESGLGLEGARVFALAPPTSNAARQGLAMDQVPFVEATSGPGGAFRLEGLSPGWVLLVARHRAHYLPQLQAARRRTVTTRTANGTSSIPVSVPPADLLVMVPSTTRRIERDIAMAKGSAVRGLVLDPSGAPASGAHILVHVPGAGMAGVVPYSPWGSLSAMGLRPPPDSDLFGSTDGEGRFEIRDLPPGRKLLLRAKKDPHVAGNAEELTLESGGKVPSVTLHLTEGATLIGRVVDEDGVGIAGAYIHSHGQTEAGLFQQASTRTESGGAFRLEGAATQGLRLSVSATGYRSGDKTQKTFEALLPGTLESDLVFELERGVQVSGVLVDRQGKPLSRTMLQLIPTEGRASVYARTDEAGAFTFPGAPEGEVRVALGIGFGHTRRSVPVGDAFQSPVEGLRLVYDAPPQRVLEGRVLDAQGMPIPSCDVTIAGETARAPDPWSVVRMTQVVGGSFRRVVEGEPPYEVRVTNARGADGEPLNLQPHSESLTPTADGTFTIRLEEGANLAGRVVGPGGEGVGDVLVEAPSTSSWSAPDGRFELWGLPPEGTVTLRVVPPDGFLEQKNLRGRTGDREFLVRLEREMRVTGIVLDSDDEPLPRTAIQVRWTAPRGASGHTFVHADGKGRFEVDGLPSKAMVALTVYVMSGGKQRVPVQVDNVAAGTEDLEIRVGGGVAISGSVVDASGRPFTKGWVRVEAADADGGGDPPLASLGEDGTFELDGLPPGRYRVQLQRQVPGPAPEPKEVVAPAEGLRLVIPQAQGIEGKLVGPVPVQGFRVRALQEGFLEGLSPSAEVGTDGRFVVEGLGDGTFTLFAEKKDADHYARLEGVQAGTSDVELRLVEGLALGGSLRHANGDPVEEGWIWVKGPLRSTTAAIQDGVFAVRGLPPGVYSIKGAAKSESGQFGGWTEFGEHEAGQTSLALRLE